MKKLLSIFLCFWFIQGNFTYSQSFCLMLNSANNDLADEWKRETGTWKDSNINITGTNIAYKVNKNLEETDSRTGNLLKCVPSGETYSIRLGDEKTGARIDRLIYQLTVDEHSTLFLWKFAVVLQDPGHVHEQQPAFSIYIKDADKNIINACGTKYEVAAGNNISGFNTHTISANNIIRWRDWTTVGLDLSPYMNQTVRIEIETKDCSPTGHYGYGYFVGKCQPMNINVTYCEGSSSATLTAPEGFQSYRWSNGSTNREITISNPQDNAKYTCVLTSHLDNCEVTLETTIRQTKIVSDFTYTLQDCKNKKFQFTNTSIINNEISSDFLWNFGDDTSEIETSPNHIFSTQGTKNITLTVTNSGCSKSITKQVAVPPSLPSSILIDSIPEVLCSGAKLSVVPNIVGISENSEYNYTWQYSSNNENWVGGIALTPTLIILPVEESHTGYYRLSINPKQFSQNSCVVTSDPKLINIKNCPCTNCPSSFAPRPGEQYVLSAWVKEADEIDKSSYENTSISLVFELLNKIENYEMPLAKPSGYIIDGWQRIYYQFTIPAYAHKMYIKLNNSGSSQNVFFDDIRVHPFNASMKSYVYDPSTLRLSAELDDNNYATFYEYDEEGALIRVKKETEKGVMTIREARQGQQKKQ